MKAFQLKIANSQNEYNLSWADIRPILKEIPVEYMEFTVKNNRLHHKESYPNDRGLLNAAVKNRHYFFFIAV